MAVLLTGGTGKTSLRLAHMLQNAEVPFLLASRKAQEAAPQGMQAVKFDWLDESTYQNPFEYKFPDGEKISAVYIIAPQVQAPSPYTTALVDLAAKHGVKRFVMLTGSSDEKGGFYNGKTWQHLEDIGAEYLVLRATWFMENLSEWQYVGSIKSEGKIYTGCGDGKIPFISANDIAATAFHGLTGPPPHPSDIRVLGPELLTYDQIAEKMSNALGRKITHVKLSEEEVFERYKTLGLPEHTAKFMASIETTTGNGAEERMNDAVEKFIGRPPQKFDEWVEENKSAWQ